jgi:hypothetical protein
MFAVGAKGPDLGGVKKPARKNIAATTAVRIADQNLSPLTTALTFSGEASVDEV